MKEGEDKEVRSTAIEEVRPPATTLDVMPEVESRSESLGQRASGSRGPEPRREATEGEESVQPKEEPSIEDLLSSPSDLKAFLKEREENFLRSLLDIRISQRSEQAILQKRLNGYTHLLGTNLRAYLRAAQNNSERVEAQRELETKVSTIQEEVGYLLAFLSVMKPQKDEGLASSSSRAQVKPEIAGIAEDSLPFKIKDIRDHFLVLERETSELKSKTLGWAQNQFVRLDESIDRLNQALVQSRLSEEAAIARAQNYRRRALVFGGFSLLLVAENLYSRFFKKR